MSNELLVQQGLLHDEFIIKGDNDYIELCNFLMIKYNQLKQENDNLKFNYNKKVNEINNLKRKNNEVRQIDLIDNYFFEKLDQLRNKEISIVNKIRFLEQKNIRLENYHLKLLKLQAEVDFKYNISKNLKKLRYDNRILRIRIINLKKKHIKLYNNNLTK